MGIKKNVGADEWPMQGRHLGRRVMVCFHYDTSRMFGGVVVRDDAEEPGTEIIRLDDGRHVLSTECMYSVPVRCEHVHPPLNGYDESWQCALERGHPGEHRPYVPPSVVSFPVRRRPTSQTGEP